MTRQEIITALEFCIRGKRFPHDECDFCPLRLVRCDVDKCAVCIDNLMGEAARMLQRDGDMIVFGGSKP